MIITYNVIKIHIDVRLVNVTYCNTV